MAQSQPIKQKPTHRLYQVTGEGKTANWRPIGTVWMHRDGKGFSMSLDVMPLKGRVVGREIKAATQAEGVQQ